MDEIKTETRSFVSAQILTVSFLKKWPGWKGGRNETQGIFTFAIDG